MRRSVKGTSKIAVREVSRFSGDKIDNRGQVPSGATVIHGNAAPNYVMCEGVRMEERNYHFSDK